MKRSKKKALARGKPVRRATADATDEPVGVEALKAAIGQLIREMGPEDTGRLLEGDPDGERQISLSPRMAEVLRLQKKLFIAKFGREPGPGDPVFFDWDKDEVARMHLGADTMARDFLRAGVRPEIAYAASKTGLILTETNQHLFSDDAKEEWEDAIDEFLSLSEEEKAEWQELVFSGN